MTNTKLYKKFDTKVSSKPFHEMAFAGNVDGIIEYLDTDNFEINECDNSGRNALHWACSGNHIRIVDHLISSDININAKDDVGWTALMVATSVGSVPIVEYLIENGADVTIPDINGYQCIHVSISKHKPQIMQLLINSGADVNACKNEMNVTPISRAVSVMDYNIISQLLKLKVDIDMPDKSGNSLLHIACENEDYKSVKILLEHGALIIKNKESQYPYDFIRNLREKMFK
ncbi:26S proteasome non-ATPase regulatory subunit 10 [Intoshia linei]|uniref:26S proteasome non-ATPase regulatory subunit 10 n=1 Tax=Intoshia linei TaxID=1819745 RepID=A0A177AXI9_9BILA|nr:26S proteasome non-ATPase regulatory subunit 10 [Intoshia linei]